MGLLSLSLWKRAFLQWCKDKEKLLESLRALPKLCVSVDNRPRPSDIGEKEIMAHEVFCLFCKHKASIRCLCLAGDDPRSRDKDKQLDLPK